MIETAVEARDRATAPTPDERTPPGIVELALRGRERHREIALAWSVTGEAPATKRLSGFLLEHFGR